MSLASRIALVTGAASGLGKATADRFLKEGARVVLCDLQQQGMESTNSDRALVCPTDVTLEEEVKAALEIAHQTFGRPIDTVVNCAGIGLARKMLSRNKEGGESDASSWRVHDQEAFDRILEVNVAGTFNVIRLAVENMVSNNTNSNTPEGVIVNTASIAAYDGQIGQVAYAASKAAIVGMTLPLARDLAQYEIRVNAIAPGLFQTPLLEGLPQKMQDSLGASVPFPSRLGSPDEFAMLVQSIVENPMINGEVIRIDGALRMPPK